ncbi:hypothetical protein MT302_14330 [Bacillus amyloliquefaciens]|nr:hypothetical protein [Bacillus amyloliquefaciens]MCJ2175942.1 hypothetical protein [Bacillus amyloliquefaciens]
MNEMKSGGMKSGVKKGITCAQKEQKTKKVQKTHIEFRTACREKQTGDYEK